MPVRPRFVNASCAISKQLGFRPRFFIIRQEESCFWNFSEAGCDPNGCLILPQEVDFGLRKWTLPPQASVEKADAS
jgi:hypothetical protein